jgi:hypothetical protein
MKCKKQPECAQKMHMFSKVPPLEPGETEIVTAEMGPSPAPGPAAASFLQGGHVSTMRVNFTRMGEDHSVHMGQVQLAMELDDAASESDSWTKEVTEVGGKITEHHASCNNGKFHCQGDAAWCSAQEQVVCPGSQTALHQRFHTQGHLQP